MTAPCREWEQSLLEKVAGELDAAAELRVDGHLESCAACRAEAEALRQVLSLAALPPVTDAERRALAGSERAALAAWKRSVRRRRLFAAGTAVFAVAAAALLVVISPGLLRGSGPGPLAQASSSWRVPDVDADWSLASAVGPGGDATDEVSADADDGSDDSVSDDALYAELDAVDPESL